MKTYYLCYESRHGRPHSDFFAYLKENQAQAITNEMYRLTTPHDMNEVRSKLKTVIKPTDYLLIIYQTEKGIVLNKIYS